MKSHVKEMTKQFYQVARVTQNPFWQDTKKINEFYLAGDWNALLDTCVPVSYNQVAVYGDFSAAVYWASKLGRSNVFFQHPDSDFVRSVNTSGIQAMTDINQMPKNIPQVGNPAFSVAEEVYLGLPSKQEVCMVMPAWAVTAPNWKANGWSDKQKVKSHLESIGLKYIYWIPNGSFEQLTEDGKKDTAQVDSVLVITEPGYQGDVTVTDLLDNTSYTVSRGGVYPRRSSTLQHIDRYSVGNNYRFREDQKKDNVAKQWSLGVNIYNPFAKGKGANGPHLKGMQIFSPGDTIKKNTCYCEFNTEVEARSFLAKITLDSVAQAYQDLTTQKSFSGVVFRMLKV
jgi:hypothetical protein